MNEKTCKVCGKPLRKRNKTELCQKCYLADYQKIHRQRAIPIPEIWAICWNKHCAKEFRLKSNQHPKYSLCPECQKKREELRGWEWIEHSLNFKYE